MLTFDQTTRQGKRGLSAESMSDMRSKAFEGRKRAQAIPKTDKIKLTDATGAELAIEYVAGGTNQHGAVVVFGWTKAKNEAGFYVGFREVRRKSGKVHRYDFSTRRQRYKLHALARGRAAAFEEKHGATCHEEAERRRYRN